MRSTESLKVVVHLLMLDELSYLFNETENNAAIFGNVSGVPWLTPWPLAITSHPETHTRSMKRQRNAWNSFMSSQCELDTMSRAFTWIKSFEIGFFHLKIVFIFLNFHRISSLLFDDCKKKRIRCRGSPSLIWRAAELMAVGRQHSIATSLFSSFSVIHSIQRLGMV